MNLPPRHRLIALQLAAGRSHAQIAQAVGMHLKSVSRLASKPEIKAAVEEAAAELEERVIVRLVDRFDDAAPDAFEELMRLMREGKSETVRHRAAESILDRSQVAPKRQIHSRHEVESRQTILHLDGKELRRLIAVMIEEGMPPSELRKFLPEEEQPLMLEGQAE